MPNSLLRFAIAIFIPICFANTKFSNSTHEIYTITTFDNSTNDSIDCTLPNCLIQCRVQDICYGISINAVNINNLDISCHEYNSCNNMEINANNQTNVNMKCFYAHSCPHTVISTVDSYLSLECDQQDSCQDMSIIINKPLQNSITVSCNADDSCESLEIHLLTSLSLIPTDANWLNISVQDANFDVLILCDINSNTSLQLDQSNDIQCSNNICCPANYQISPINTTSFYSTTTIFISTITDDMLMFEYFAEYLVPLFYFCILYTILVSIWAIIYFCCNTFGASIKCKSVTHLNNIHDKNKVVDPNSEEKESEGNQEPLIKSAINAVMKGSSCCRKCGYFMDAFNVTTDIVLFLSIMFNASLAYDTQLWSIAEYVSIGAAAFGLLLYILKFRLLKKFYPYIFVWRMQIELEQNTQPNNKKAMISKWKTIASKNKKISRFLGYLVMYDLFSASFQDSLQAIVILYIFSDLRKGDGTVKLLNKEWKEYGYFQWILRLKLVICIIFMVYKLLNALFVECKCHSDKIKTKSTIKPKFIDSDSEEDIEMEEQLLHYQNMNTPIVKPTRKPIKNIHDGYTQLITPRTPASPASPASPAGPVYPNSYENMEIEMQPMVSKPKTKQIEHNEMDQDDDLKLMQINKEEILPDEWTKLTTPGGKTYYQNRITQSTQWKKPVQTFVEKQPEKHVAKTYDAKPIEKHVKDQIIIEENKHEQDQSESDENVFSDVFKDMKKTKKKMGNVLGDEFESKWNENIVGLVDENQEQLRTEAMKTVMLSVVDSLFDNIETGDGAKQFFKAVQIMTTVAHEDEEKKEEIEEETDRLHIESQDIIQNELNEINEDEDALKMVMDESVDTKGMNEDELENVLNATNAEEYTSQITMNEAVDVQIVSIYTDNDIELTDDYQQNDDEILDADINENNYEAVNIDEQKMIEETELLEDNDKLTQQQLEISISMDDEQIEIENDNNIEMNNEMDDTNSDMLLVPSTADDNDNDQENIITINNLDNEKQIQEEDTDSDHDSPDNVIMIDDEATDEIKTENEEYNYGSDDIGVSLIQATMETELNTETVIAAFNNEDEMQEKANIEVDINADDNIKQVVLDLNVSNQEEQIMNGNDDIDDDEITFKC